MSIQAFGLDAFRAAVDRGIDLAEAAEGELRASPEWEVLTPAQLAIVTFRFRAPGLADAEVDALQRRITAEATRGGFAMLSTTALGGRATLRLCTINPRTTDADVRETVRLMARIGRELSRG
jgi:glutamate/tyrosine decarboxylase-like PLP-dependent enzyme